MHNKNQSHNRQYKKNLDNVMPMYNLWEYYDNYSMIPGSLWNYYGVEVNDHTNENNVAYNYRINSNKATTSKSFWVKIKMTGSTPADNSG